MNPRWPGAAAAVLVVASACGRNAEEMRFDAMQATCNGLAAGTTTLAEATKQFGFTGALLCPTQPLTPMKVGDNCPYSTQFNCKGYWASVSADPSRCNQLVGGCYYWCEVRFPGAPGAVNVPDTTVICGSWFVSGQPYLPPDFP